MTPVEVLRAAKACILEHGWAQGDDVMETDQHCIVTALAWPESDPASELAAHKFLELAIGTAFPHEWNDAPERTEDDILDAFDRAIALASTTKGSP